MRKFYLLLFLLVSGFGFGQVNLAGNAHYVLESRLKIGEAHSSGYCGSGGLNWLYILKGRKEIFFKPNEAYNNEWENRAETFDTIHFSESKLITSFTIHSRYRHGHNWDCETEHESEITKSILRKESITYIDDEVYAKNIAGSLTMETYPVINLKNPDIANNLIGTESSIAIPPIESVSNEYFDWMYHIEGEQHKVKFPFGIVLWVDTWRSLPAAYQQKNSLTIKCKDFLAYEAVGKKIWLRANVKGTTVELNYAKSAPHIDLVPPIQTSCFDTKDGRVVLKFSSKLVAGEILSYSVSSYDEKTGKIREVVFSTQEDETILIGDDLTYEIPYNFEKGKYNIKLLGFYKRDGYKANTYVMDPNHQPDFIVSSPTPVDFSITKRNDVLCYGGGEDGIIDILASGGTDNGIYQYSTDDGVKWKTFLDGNKHAITGLSMGDCKVKVRKIKDTSDQFGCVAKDANGKEEVTTLTISQPAAPVSLSSHSIEEPKFYGGSNGKITASISGGTPIDGKSYRYEWRNSKNVIIDNAKTTTQFGGDLFAITLNDVPADTYTLTVWDANYDIATNKEGCTILPVISIVLTQPDPIVVTLKIRQTISCNVSNEFGNETDMDPYDKQRDESQDGILLAEVKGGVPFTGSENGGLPYKYYWKKQQVNGSWVLLDDQDATAQYLSDGNYSLNVADKKGIRLGDYVNNILVLERDSIQFMTQPPRLELKFTKEDILCSKGDNGWAKVHVEGGTPPYNYQWSTGATTDSISKLTSNNYFVRITDAKGCSVQGSVLIEQPNGMLINELLHNPSCFEGNDGFINLAPTGGVPPYHYKWNTGADTKDISNLVAGNYSVILTDAQDCILMKNFVLTDPAPIVIDLGSDRTLCSGQAIDLDASIDALNASYIWTSTNGFTSNEAKVNLIKAGTYHVKVISNLGCIGEDTIVIKTNERVIHSEFLLSSQAYIDEEVILVNTSNPFGETTKWIAPEGVTVIEEKEKYITFKFNDLGTYPISLRQTQGDCYTIYTKNVTVEQRSILPNAGAPNSSFTIDFIVTPNPSDGNFQVAVNLEHNSPVNLRLFSSGGQYALLEKKEVGKKNYLIDFNAPLASGIYVLVLETAQQTLVKKIIIY
jgi:hypothetical protein